MHWDHLYLLESKHAVKVVIGNFLLDPEEADFLVPLLYSLPGPARTLEVSNEVIYLSISLFVVGFGVGPLVFAPMSEVVGRRIIYAISMFFCK